MIRKKITNFDVLRHSMDWKLGLQESDPKNILANKWDTGFFNKIYLHMKDVGINTRYWREFTKHMKDRLIFGEFRYGKDCPFQLAAFYRDYKASAFGRGERYLQDHNLEHLIDAANCFYIDWVTTNDHESLRFVMFVYMEYFTGREHGREVITQHDKEEKDRIQTR